MGQKILVVDDAREVVALIQAMLEGQGYTVVTAANGVEGLQQARVERPALVIADVLMPEMDGYLFFKELRKDPRTQKIPVLILTARSKMETSFRAIGVNGFLPKPIDANKLLAEVAREMSMFLGAKDQLNLSQTAPQTVEDLGPAAGARAAPGPTSFGAPADGDRRAVVFGYESSVAEQIAQQLAEKKRQVRLVDQPTELAEAVRTVDPGLIFVEVLGGGAFPTPRLLGMIRPVIQELSIARMDGRPEAAIILYKVHHAIRGETSMASDIADTDQLLQECEEAGFSKYIGLYSPFSFLTKIKEFLRR